MLCIMQVSVKILKICVKAYQVELKKTNLLTTAYTTRRGFCRLPFPTPTTNVFSAQVEVFTQWGSSSAENNTHASVFRHPPIADKCSMQGDRKILARVSWKFLIDKCYNYMKVGKNTCTELLKLNWTKILKSLFYYLSNYKAMGNTFEFIWRFDRNNISGVCVTT